MPPKIQLKLSYPRLTSQRAPKLILISLSLLLLGMFIPTFVNPGTLDSFQKISDTHGGFLGSLENSNNIGVEVAEIGNLDGDRVPDLAVGACNPARNIGCL